jgi:hypothetical protein
LSKHKHKHGQNISTPNTNRSVDSGVVQEHPEKTSADTKKSSIVKEYSELYAELQRSPTMEELVARGHTKDSIKHHFGSLSNIDKLARDTFPDKFFDVDIETILDDAARDRLRKTVKKYKQFVVTTAVTGCAVDEGFYASLKSYCKANKAALLILIASDPAHNHSKGGYGTIDGRLIQEAVVVEDTHLNSNFFISTIKLSAKQINPTTGLGDIGKRDGSFVFASPKQSMVLESTSNEKLPHVMMTTGAITKPNYTTDMYMSERTAYIADKHHVMGAIVVTIQDSESYAYTQVQMMNEEGSFVHFGKRYHPDNAVTDEAPEALVCGDWHSGVTDPQVRKGTEEMLKFFKPTHVVLHDAFDGVSVNHHEESNEIMKAVRFMTGAKSLEQEIVGLKDDLDWFAAMVEQVVVVKSNHDLFLAGHYLKHAKYAKDPQNHYFSLDLAKAMMEGKDPLKFATEKVGLKLKHKVRWLSRDEDFKIADIQLGAHGDIGPSGTRGNLKNMRKAYGLSITGHSHTPGILHGAWAVGTSSLLRLSYNHGPSSWMNTHALVYSDGSRQLVNLINGKWRI